MKKLITFNLGKNGLTDNFIDSLEKTFKKQDLIRIAVLKSATRDKEEIQKIARTLCSELKKRQKKDFTSKQIGFTIFIRKWRKLKKGL